MSLCLIFMSHSFIFLEKRCKGLNFQLPQSQQPNLTIVLTKWKNLKLWKFDWLNWSSLNQHSQNKVTWIFKVSNFLNTLVMLHVLFYLDASLVCIFICCQIGIHSWNVLGAMETFAEAWVAANTGKFSSGAVVNPLATTGSPLDFNKAAESIIQQQLVSLIYLKNYSCRLFSC